MVSEDRPIAISSSSQLAPDEVARHTFATTRRGFAIDEVRTYLDSLAQGLRGLADREHDLLRRLDEAQQRAANPIIDEETLTAALGHETARVLHSAHEAAAEMLAKAESEAVRLLAEAREEISQTEVRVGEQLSERAAQAEAVAGDVRNRAHEESAAALEAARAEVEGMLAQARGECRDMVEEAQALRARVLADLSRRRKVLHAQIEQLRAGREHLAETVRDVRRSIDTIAEDLFRAEDEARMAAESAGREAVARPDEGTPEEIAAVLLAEEADEAEQADGVVDRPAPVDWEEHAFEDSRAGGEGPDSKVDEVASGGDRETEPVDPADSELVDPTNSELVEPAEPVDEETVDALFAKIRASREDEDSTADNDMAVGPPDDQIPLAVQRDEMIGPIVTALARRMKRALQDDQNDLLDRVRSNGSRWSTDLLRADSEHRGAYVAAALPHLEQAARAGCSFAGRGETGGSSVGGLSEVADELAGTVVGQLRRRLSDDERVSGTDVSAVADQVGAVFREWKGERVERLAGDFVVSAFGTGCLAVADHGATSAIAWVAVGSSDDEPCPDCEDNALNGPQRPGEAFPTGHTHPPVHPGCRCLLVPSST
jgi:DivIVA domain-containing protein